MAATQTLPRSYGGRVPSEHQIFVLVRMRLEAYGGVARELLRTANKMLVPWRDSFLFPSSFILLEQVEDVNKKCKLFMRILR